MTRDAQPAEVAAVGDPSALFTRGIDEAIVRLRESTVEELTASGLSVRGTFDEVDDPILVGPGGVLADSWREEYPYEHRMERQEYDETKRLLQIELLKAQAWIQESGMTTPMPRTRCSRNTHTKLAPRLPGQGPCGDR